jgi:hypothetical protein
VGDGPADRTGGSGHKGYGPGPPPVPSPADRTRRERVHLVTAGHSRRTVAARARRAGEPRRPSRRAYEYTYSGVAPDGRHAMPQHELYSNLTASPIIAKANQTSRASRGEGLDPPPRRSVTAEHRASSGSAFSGSSEEAMMLPRAGLCVAMRTERGGGRRS